MWECLFGWECQHDIHSHTISCHLWVWLFVGFAHWVSDVVRLSRLDCGCGLRYPQVRLGCLQVRKLQCGLDGGCG